PDCLFATIATAAHYTGEHISFGHVKLFRFPLRIEVGSVLCVRAFSADLQVGRNPPCVSPHWRYLWAGRDGGVAIIGVERRSVVSSIHHRRRPSCRYRARASLGFYAPRPLPSIHRGRRPIRLHCPGRRRPHYLFGTIATTHTIPRSTSRLLARNLFGPRVSWRSDRWVRWVTCAQWPL